ncbi:hypothetical protein PFFCH_05711, partial [Plasmodium falciparum FCH/4]
CIGENNGKNCSREGYDCNKTNLKLNEIFVDLDCPRCEKACTSYNEWLKKKEGEFNKQKKKYEKEIENNQSNSHSTYDNELYNNLKKNYPSVKEFVETLKEGAYCTNNTKDGEIDFNKQYDTFSHSQYCKSCPILGAECKNGQCNSFNDITCPKIQNILNISTYKIKNTIDINMLVNNNKKKQLSDDLKDDFNDCDFFKRLRRQNWNCKYKCNINVCELKNFVYGIDDEKVMLIGVLIKRWLKYFLKDYSKIKEKLNHCINNEEKKISCIRGCYKNCECVEKWISKKEKEWTDIKARYVQQYESKDEDVSSKLKKFLKQELFTNYVKNALATGETLDTMKESDGCKESSESKGKSCKRNDVITILLNRLEDKMKKCKTQHDQSKNENCFKTLPPPPRPRRRRPPVLRRGVRRVPRARQGGEREAEEKKEEEKEEDTEGKVQPPPAPTQSACEIVDGILK